METNNQQTVGQVVAKDYRTAQVFKDFGLDFCCGGDKTINAASAEKGIDPNEVRAALEDFREPDSKELNYDAWSLDFLIDYIINNHHNFYRTELPEINFYAKKVLSAHGESHPELEEIYYKLIKFYTEMTDHMDEEESLPFPYIKKLVEAERDQKVLPISRLEMMEDPIKMLIEDHEEAGEAMARIRELTNNFTPPEDACATYRLLYEKLQAFEKDLHKHVHLENNILFPKALKLESKLNNKFNSEEQLN